MYPSESTKQLLNDSFGQIGELRGYDKLQKILEGNKELQEFPLRFVLTVWGESLDRLLQQRTACDLAEIIEDVGSYFDQNAQEKYDSSRSQVSYSRHDIDTVKEFMSEHIDRFQSIYNDIGPILELATKREAAATAKVQDHYKFEPLNFDHIEKSYENTSHQLRNEIEALKKRKIGEEGSKQTSPVKSRAAHNISHPENAYLSQSRVDLQSPAHYKQRAGEHADQSSMIRDSRTSDMHLSETKRNPLETTFFKDIKEDLKEVKKALKDMVGAQPLLAENGSQPRFEKLGPGRHNEATPAREFGMKDAQSGGIPVSAIKKSLPQHDEPDDSILNSVRGLKSPTKDRKDVVRGMEEVLSKVEKLEGVMGQVEKTTEYLSKHLQDAAKKATSSSTGSQIDKSVDTMMQVFIEMLKYFEKLPQLESDKISAKSKEVAILKEQTELDQKLKEQDCVISQESAQELVKMRELLEKIAAKETSSIKNFKLTVEVGLVKQQVLDMKKKALEAHLSALAMITGIIKRDLYGSNDWIKQIMKQHFKEVETLHYKAHKELQEVSKFDCDPQALKRRSVQMSWSVW